MFQVPYLLCTKKLGIVILIAELVIYLIYQIRCFIIKFFLLEYSVPALGDKFLCIVESVHLPDNGCTPNVNIIDIKLLLKADSFYIAILGAQFD